MTLTTNLTKGLLLQGVTVAAALGQMANGEQALAFSQVVAFDVNLERSTFEAREPIIAHVRVRNLRDEPLTLLVRPGGAPVRMALETSCDNGPYSEHSLSLERSGPQRTEKKLGPRKTTTGDVLVLLDFGNDYVFPNPGEYHLRWNFYSGLGKALVYSNETRVTVLPMSRVNEECLAQLELIALRYHIGDDADHLDLNAPEAEKGLDQEGILLLAQITSETKPYLIDPDDKREMELVDSLAKTLERYPDSVYSGYIARYLGLVYVKTLEHEASLAGWLERDPERARAHPAYVKALHYLTMAKDANVWPRTAALENLVWLHGLAQEWEKTSEYLGALRQQCPDIGGPGIADKLEGQMQRFREKIEARKAREATSP